MTMHPTGILWFWFPLYVRAHAIYFCNIDCSYYSTYPGTSPINSHRSIDSVSQTNGKIIVKRGTTGLISGKSTFVPGEILSFTASTPVGQQLGMTIDNGGQIVGGYCQGKNRTYTYSNTLSGSILMPTLVLGKVRIWVEWSSFAGDTIHVSPFFVLLNPTNVAFTQIPSQGMSHYPSQGLSRYPTENITHYPSQGLSSNPTENITQNPTPSLSSNPTENITYYPSQGLSHYPTLQNISKYGYQDKYILSLFSGAIGGAIVCMGVLICMIQNTDVCWQFFTKTNQPRLFLELEEQSIEVDIPILND